MKVKLTATASYDMQCVEYIVSGSYSVSVRQADGSQVHSSGTSATATVVSGGCQGPHATVLEVDAVTEYDAAFSGDKFILGYRTHFVQSTPLLHGCPMLHACHTTAALTPVHHACCMTPAACEGTATARCW